MHELSIAENIVEIVTDSARQSGADRVTAITVEIGRLSGVLRDALEFAMEISLKGSPAEGAEVNYVVIDGQATCHECGKQSIIEDLFSPCPHCGSQAIDLIAGRELRIARIEVITADC